jgi:IS5 family transposase
MIKYKYQTKGGTPMNQMTLTDMEYSNRKKKTKREEFFDAMDEISG